MGQEGKLKINVKTSLISLIFFIAIGILIFFVKFTYPFNIIIFFLTFVSGLVLVTSGIKTTASMYKLESTSEKTFSTMFLIISLLFLFVWVLHSMNMMFIFPSLYVIGKISFFMTFVIFFILMIVYNLIIYYTKYNK